MGAPQAIHLETYLPLAVATAGTADTRSLAICPAGTWKIKAAYFSPDTAVTANDTNYATIALKNGATTIASESTTTTDTGNLTAQTPVALALTGTGKDLEFAQGEAVTIAVTKAASGVAIDGQVCVYLEQLRV